MLFFHWTSQLSTSISRYADHGVKLPMRAHIHHELSTPNQMPYNGYQLAGPIVMGKQILKSHRLRARDDGPDPHLSAVGPSWAMTKAVEPQQIHPLDRDQPGKDVVPPSDRLTRFGGDFNLSSKVIVLTVRRSGIPYDHRPVAMPRQ